MGLNVQWARFAYEGLCVRTRRFHRFDRLIKALRPHTPELYEVELRGSARVGTRNGRGVGEPGLSGADVSCSDCVHLRTVGCNWYHPLELERGDQPIGQVTPRVFGE